MADEWGARTMARRRIARLVGRRPASERPARSADAPPSEPAPRYGPKPKVVHETTHYGPMVDALVERVRRNQRRYGVNEEYDLVREHFDHYQFMLAATHLQEDPEVDPIRTFLRAGAEAVNNPEPDFSMRKYLQRHPEHADGPERSPYLEWLKRGKEAGENADPADGIEALAPLLGLEPARAIKELTVLRADMIDRLRHGTLGEMFAKAAEIDPLIGGTLPATTRISQLPFRNESVARAAAAIHRAHQAADFRPARLVVVAKEPRWGGGRRIEGHLAHALAASIDPSEIVVIYTDEAGTAPAGRFPDGVREIPFATYLDGVADAQREEALVGLLRSFRADAIFNVSSGLLYQAMVAYGPALASSERLFLCFFGAEQHALGFWEGRMLRWIYPTLEYVAGIVTDAEVTRSRVVEHHLLSEAQQTKVHVFSAPAEPEIPLAEVPPRRPRPVVWWAGRFDRQKRVQLALEVARRMPDVDFRCWGEPVLAGDRIVDVPDNVTMPGPYDRFADLDLSEVDAWLYTSAWDGVPSLLMEVGMTGVPIVASRVGGVAEILSDSDSWQIADWENPVAYVAALREVLADPESARRKGRALRERLLAERSQDAYAAQVAEVLLRPGPAGRRDDGSVR